MTNFIKNWILGLLLFYVNYGLLIGVNKILDVSLWHILSLMFIGAVIAYASFVFLTSQFNFITSLGHFLISGFFVFVVNWKAWPIYELYIPHNSENFGLIVVEIIIVTLTVFIKIAIDFLFKRLKFRTRQSNIDRYWNFIVRTKKG